MSLFITSPLVKCLWVLLTISTDLLQPDAGWITFPPEQCHLNRSTDQPTLASVRVPVHGVALLQPDLTSSGMRSKSLPEYWRPSYWITVLLISLAMIFYLIKKYVIISVKLKKTLRRERPRPDSSGSLLDQLFLEKVQSLIQHNYQNADFTAHTLILEMAMSRTAFYRKFKSLSCRSVNDLIRDHRLKKARELLIQSGLSVSEIAYASGFSNPAYFSTVFKEHFHVPPGNFREEQTVSQS